MVERADRQSAAERLARLRRGMAAVHTEFIDAGTLAGDNTLIVLFPDEATLLRWLDRFNAIQAPAEPVALAGHAREYSSEARTPSGTSSRSTGQNAMRVKNSAAVVVSR